VKQLAVLASYDKEKKGIHPGESVGESPVRAKTGPDAFGREGGEEERSEPADARK
jgi:hypothetical protein